MSDRAVVGGLRVVAGLGDVTDKGVPVALVMATCRSTVRAVAARGIEPEQVLSEVNDTLVGEIPERMFVTCLYGVLDPRTGELRFANAGHNLPYVRSANGVAELRATGMPLGLIAGMSYEAATALLAPGDTMVLSSDGIVEAHDSGGQMYGFDRLMRQVSVQRDDTSLLLDLVADLDGFTGPTREQEDDVTLVSFAHVSAVD